MSGYHNVILPDEFSQGSVFAVGFDTRINQLENGQEFRLARGLPWGRRRYSLLRGVARPEDIQELYKFFIMRQGALNSFKFKDWNDYASNTTGATHRPNIDDPITATDQALVATTGNRTYQLVKRYTDSIRTITRVIMKPIAGTFITSVNGSPTTDYTLDPETGIVTYDASLDPITTVTAGFEFYTTVRFAESTDKSFEVLMRDTFQSNELPGIELVEELYPSTVSQDYQFGGATSIEGLSTDIRITEVNGRLQCLQPLSGSLSARLPNAFDTPLGGPIVVLHNLSVSNDIEITTSSGDALVTLEAGQTLQFFLGVTADNTARFWIAV